jgi:hypothetical protein
VPPDGERRFAYVTTSGCAAHALPESPYNDGGNTNRVEFVMAALQTGDREADVKSLEAVIHTVRRFAKMAHLSDVPVNANEAIIFQEDPQPIYKDADFRGIVFAQPLLPAPGFEYLQLEPNDPQSRMKFVAIIPAFLGEMEYSARKGADALCRAFKKNSVTEILDFNREAQIFTDEFKNTASAAPKSSPKKTSLIDRLLSLVGIK